MAGVARWRIFAALCAAAAHDTGHPGLNNVFWAASGSELALSYHGRSVLENYHIYQAFALMRERVTNIRVFGVEDGGRATLYRFEAVVE